MAEGPESQGIAQIRYRVILRTLTFVLHGEDVLLLKGASSKTLWPNLYNGVGGHVERGEDVRSAALREIEEETGLAVRQVRLRGVLHIDAGDDATGVMLFVFTALAEGREFRNSPEGTLEWVPVGDVRQRNLVEDLTDLLSRIRSLPADAPPFFAYKTYGADGAPVVAFAPAEDW